MGTRMNLTMIKTRGLNQLVWMSLCIVSTQVQGGMPVLAGQALVGKVAAMNVTGETLGSLESGPGQKFASNQFSIRLPLEQKSRKSESFQSSFNAAITQFDWRGTTAAQADYLWLSMPIHYQQKRSRYDLFMLHIEPGLMTDGNNLGIDHIGINGSIMGRRLWGDGGFWQYGLTVDRAFGDYDVRPVIAIGFHPSKSTWVELGFPEVNVKHQISAALASYFVIKPAGGVWREEIKLENENKDANLHYSSWQVGLAADFHWRESLWLEAELGQLRHRRIRANDASGTILKGTPGQDKYWRIGASLKF